MHSCPRRRDPPPSRTVSAGASWTRCTWRPLLCKPQWRSPQRIYHGALRRTSFLNVRPIEKKIIMILITTIIVILRRIMKPFVKVFCLYCTYVYDCRILRSWARVQRAVCRLGARPRLTEQQVGPRLGVGAAGVVVSSGGGQGHSLHGPDSV